ATAVRSTGDKSGNKITEMARSRAEVRTLIDPKSVPAAAIPGLANKPSKQRPGATDNISTEKNKAARGKTITSIANKNRNSEIVLPRKRAPGASGLDNKPVSARPSRSRAQLRPSDKTAANNTDSQITPDITARPESGPPWKDIEARTTTSTAKNALVMVTSNERISVCASFWITSQTCCI